MDPNANLKEQRELAATILRDADAEDPYGDIREGLQGKAIRMAELVQALDGWIRGGGYLPEDWREQQDDMLRTIRAGFDVYDTAPNGDYTCECDFSHPGNPLCENCQKVVDARDLFRNLARLN